MSPAAPATPADPTVCRIGATCPWDIAGAKLRQALKPKRTLLPPWYRYHPVKPIPQVEPQPTMDLATTGGRGTYPAALLEKDPNTIESAIRREQLTRLGIIRGQLRQGRTIVWNNPDAGEFYKPHCPLGIGVYGPALTDDERQALTDEANDLRKVLHV